MKNKVILYGAEMNCGIFINFADMTKIQIMAIADQDKIGEIYGGRIVISAKSIPEYEYDELYMLIPSADDIIDYLVNEIGVRRERIVPSVELNRRYMLQNLEEYRYIMLGDANNYLNYPYLKLNARKDFTMAATLRQTDKWAIPDRKVDSEHIFIIRDHCYMKFKKEGVFAYLSAIYTNSKFVLLMSDMCEGEFGRLSEYGADYIKNIKREFDLVMTYHHKDAQRYHLNYKEQTFPSNCVKSQPNYDVLFIGRAKNRLDIIHRVYKRLTSHGVLCRFWISDVEKQKQLLDSNIIYNQRLTYAEVLNEVSKCRCILEICQTGDETSYRYAEAVTYNKKLLVNDTSCVFRKYFSKKHMRCFQIPDDIDCEWIKDAGEVNYHYNNDFSPDVFLEYIEKNLKALSREGDYYEEGNDTIV